MTACVCHMTCMCLSHDLQDGQTPLHWAALRGEMAAVRLLIEEYGVDPAIKDHVSLVTPTSCTKPVFI